jgi:hypothetical protein
MQNYIVRVYRASPDDLDSVSGLVEDIESGQKESFHNFSELQTLLAKSTGRGQLALPDLTNPTVMYKDIIAEVA